MSLHPRDTGRPRTRGPPPHPAHGALPVPPPARKPCASHFPGRPPPPPPSGRAASPATPRREKWQPGGDCGGTTARRGLGEAEGGWSRGGPSELGWGRCAPMHAAGSREDGLQATSHRGPQGPHSPASGSPPANGHGPAEVPTGPGAQPTGGPPSEPRKGAGPGPVLSGPTAQRQVVAQVARLKFQLLWGHPVLCPTHGPGLPPRARGPRAGSAGGSRQPAGPGPHGSPGRPSLLCSYRRELGGVNQNPPLLPPCPLCPQGAALRNFSPWTPCHLPDGDPHWPVHLPHGDHRRPRPPGPWAPNRDGQGPRSLRPKDTQGALLSEAQMPLPGQLRGRTGARSNQGLQAPADGGSARA